MLFKLLSKFSPRPRDPAVQALHHSAHSLNYTEPSARLDAPPLIGRERLT